jgi:hypothetical protein
MADVWTYDLPTVMRRPMGVRLFMDQKEQRPVKVETRMQLSQGARTGRTDIVTIEYASYRWGFPLSDSFFDLPKGAKFVDLGSPEAVQQLHAMEKDLKRPSATLPR